VKLTPIDVATILGQRGWGKSFLCKKAQEQFDRRIVFDPMHEYPPASGRTIVKSGPECVLALKAVRQTAKNFEIVIQFDPEIPHESLERQFDELLRVIYYFGNVLVVVEEVQEYSHPHFLPHWLRKLLLTGRHKKIAMIFTSQRPGEVHKTILAQSHYKICGKIEEGNDLRYLANFFNAETPKLVHLEPRTFLCKGPAGVETVTADAFSPNSPTRKHPKSRSKSI